MKPTANPTQSVTVTSVNTTAYCKTKNTLTNRTSPGVVSKNKPGPVLIINQLPGNRLVLCEAVTTCVGKGQYWLIKVLA